MTHPSYRLYKDTGRNAQQAVPILQMGKFVRQHTGDLANVEQTHQG